MEIGDIVLSCWSSTEIDAIGIVTGEYEYSSDGGDYPRYRNVSIGTTTNPDGDIPASGGKRRA
jgi:5-methylcytosine-specific restriction protein B